MFSKDGSADYMSCTARKSSPHRAKAPRQRLTDTLSGLRVGVIGAGPSGLTLATGAALAGADVEVFEKRPAPTDTKDKNPAQPSFSFVITPHTFEALSWIGVNLGADKTMGLLGRAAICQQGMAVVSQQKYGRQPTDRYISTERRCLIAAIAEQAAESGVQFHYDHEVINCNERTGALQVVCPDDKRREIGFDVVVFADGLHSTGRKCLDRSGDGANLSKDSIGWASLPTKPSQTLPPDYLSMCPRQYGVLDVWIPPSPFSEGPGSLLVMAPGDLISGSQVTESDLELLFPPGSRGLITYLGDASDFIGRQFRRFSYVTADRWSAGRVVCIGDAIHAAPPHTGGGANAGIQDAIALVYWLEQALIESPLADLEQVAQIAFDGFESERRPVAEAITRICRSHGDDLVSGRFSSPVSEIKRLFYGALESFAGYRSEYQKVLFETRPSQPSIARPALVEIQRRRQLQRA